MESSVIEIAWAAGFFDGEGSTTLAKKNGNAALRVVVMQKDRETLDRFQAAMGGLGSIYRTKRVKCPMYAWQTTNELDSRKVIEILRPYIGTLKREQQDRCIAGSTWHNGVQKQLKCKDPTHEIVPRRKHGVVMGKTCRTCRLIYSAAYAQKRRDQAARNEQLRLVT